MERKIRRKERRQSKKQRNGGRKKEQKEITYVFSDTDSYRSARNIALDPDLPADAVEVDRFSVSVNNINLNSLNILSKLEPRSTSTLEQQIKAMTAARLYAVGRSVSVIHVICSIS